MSQISTKLSTSATPSSLLELLLSKDKPPMLAGYRKLLVVAAAFLLLALIIYYQPTLLGEGDVADIIQWILGGFFGANAASSAAGKVAQALGPKTPAPSSEPPAPPAPVVDGDLPLGLHEPEAAALHGEDGR